jgi:hypothetical protein
VSLVKWVRRVQKPRRYGQHNICDVVVSFIKWAYKIIKFVLNCLDISVDLQNSGSIRVYSSVPEKGNRYQIRETEMGSICCTHERHEKCRRQFRL